LLALIEEESEDQMEREISAFIEQNNKEMEKALTEIKDSYSDDIQGFIDMGEEYLSVVEGMKDDMEAELENLRDQYEERKRLEVDKIMNSYKKK